MKRVFSIGKVLSLDGDGDSVDLRDGLVKGLFSAVTVEARIQVSGSVSGGHSDIFYDGIDGEIGLSWHNDETGKGVNFSVKTEEDGEWHKTPFFHIETGKWYHVAGVWFNTQVSLFVNGELRGATNTETTLHSPSRRDDLLGHPTIGAYSHASGKHEKFFNGLIDEVRVWNIARTQEEIQDAMDRTLTSDEINSGNLVGYWNFDDGSAKDLSPNHNDGRLMGDARIVNSED